MRKGDGEETSPFRASCPGCVSRFGFGHASLLSWGLNVVVGDSEWRGGSPAPRTRDCPCLLSSGAASERRGSESASSAHVRCSAPSSLEEGRPGLPSKHLSLPPALQRYFIGMVIKLYMANALVNIIYLKPFPWTSLSIHFCPLWWEICHF